MKRLLNTLFVTTEDAYLSLDGENIVISQHKKEIARYPLHILSGIISFTYAGASPALMGFCNERNISLVFCSPRGKFLARINGESHGNVLLRRTQYRIADNDTLSCQIARCSIYSKVYNARFCILRTLRDHKLRVDVNRLETVATQLKKMLPQILASENPEELRGLEGSAATSYFRIFNDLILNRKEDFFFKARSRRPPLDRVNAMLSFAYTLLVNDCASALETVGLDSYVGFLHKDRPGRKSLALDLMEELRPCFADRFVITLINNRIISPEDFDFRQSGAVLMNDNARSQFFKQWQKKKQETITHPFLKEKISWGLVPYVQAMLMARYLRSDSDAYASFLWK